MLLDILQTCGIIGVKNTTVFKLLREGELDRVRIGRRTLVTIESIERLIETNLERNSRLPCQYTGKLDEPPS